MSKVEKYTKEVQTTATMAQALDALETLGLNKDDVVSFTVKAGNPVTITAVVTDTRDYDNA